MKRKRIEYSKELLEPIIKNSISVNQVLIALGLASSGGSHKKIKEKIELYELDTSHFLGQSWGKNNPKNKGFDKEEFIKKVLIESGGLWKSHKMKLKMYKLGIKEEKCEICNLTEWCDKPISLHLDHINGINDDNRLENLRVLCPNCHSQTDTYAGKNRKNNNRSPSE